MSQHLFSTYSTSERYMGRQGKGGGVAGGITNTKGLLMSHMETCYSRRFLVQKEFKWCYHIMGKRMPRRDIKCYQIKPGSSSTQSLHYFRVPGLSVTPTTQQQSYIAEHTTHCIITQGKWTVSSWKLCLFWLAFTVLEKYHQSHPATDPGIYNSNLPTRYTDVIVA